MTYPPDPYSSSPGNPVPDPYGQQPPGGYGYPPANPYGAPAPFATRPTNTLAIGSLVTSIAGVTFGWAFCLPISVVGTVLRHVALGQIKRTGEQGGGLAWPGSSWGGPGWPRSSPWSS